MKWHSQFNVIDLATTWKADLIFRKDREFSRVEFDRRRLYTIAGMRVYVATPEDVLIAKLEWAKIGESDRQIEDAAGIISTQRSELDVVTAVAVRHSVLRTSFAATAAPPRLRHQDVSQTNGTAHSLRTSETIHAV